METEGDSKSNKEDGKETKMMEQQRKIVKTQEQTSTNWRTNKYTLESACDVLDNVKQTPKYFKKGRNEMYGKLDNLGGFQIWFTLSMADLRCVY